MIQTWPGPTAVASAADSGLPGMNLTSWMPSPLGMVMVEMMVRELMFHRRRVDARWIPGGTAAAETHGSQDTFLLTTSG